MMSNDGPPREEFRSRSRSPPRSPRDRGRSPSPARRRRSRSYSPPRSGSRHRRSRSRSPRGGGRYPRDDYHDRRPDYDRGPPPPRYGPPPDDYRGGGYRDDRYRDDRGYGGPPPDHYDGPRRGGRHGPPPGGEVRRDRQGRRRDEGPPGVSLLVRNVPHDTRSEDLQQAFGRIGVIRDVYIPRDFHTQQPKGFAFIEFATPEMAREAKHEMDRFTIRGRQIEVVFAQERRKTPNEMRGRTSEDRDGPPPRGAGSGGRSGGGGGGFQRSSSFERHKQRERNHPRDRDHDDGPSDRQDDRDD
mmetsp:Transcript_37967/g.56453  ORF Transcript_37967/g.56453 Transcript_37967/m.56453 type:complete len:300 (-) Transcript_37967:558-1457(-)|eukprot:CAMPEP_0194036028 /NCGR_PEP_ID=MMETSP0009_2-20130614/8426_1 /TAXON_ID=210454 /ORGANISM="Grammatophora oceanica, Strain CCMP 410" /LENGTH=299 /DNA_ID=CAMNT_0038677621 /DNA_START=98 /DNA_END=997 /DNA_ORIENTATION=-